MGKRIVMLIDNLGRGGKERRILELLKYLEQVDGYKILLVLFRDCVEYDDVFKLKNTKLIIIKRKIKKDVFIIFKLKKIITDFNPDLIHSWGSMTSVYSSLIAFIYKIPLLNAMVADCYYPLLGKNRFRAFITFPFSDKILSNSFNGLTAYKVPLKKGIVIRNGVHIDRFERKDNVTDTKRKFGIVTEFVVGMVAAFHPRKDYETYIKAAVQIVKEYRNVSFLAVGDGPLLGKIKNMVPENLLDRILFLGKQDNVEEIINILDIGVLISYYEGISNVIIEYMAMEKPVIGSNGGGIVEIIDNEINGYVITPRNISELKRKIAYLLEHKELRKVMGVNGRKKIESGYNIEFMARQYIDLYQDMCEKRIL